MKIYLATNSRSNAIPLAEVIVELGSEVSGISGDLIYSEQPTVDRIRESNAVVVVLGGADDELSDFASFEAGIAIAFGLPLLILTPDDRTPGWGWASQARIIRVDPNNRDALSFRLQLFLAELNAQRPSNSVRNTKPAPKIDVRNLRRTLARARQFAETVGPQVYEDWAIELFRTGGGTVARSKIGSDRGFDLAVSLPGSDSFRGPLLIEVKSSANPGSLAQALYKLEALTIHERAGLGIVFFDDIAAKSAFKLPRLLSAIAVGMDDLLDVLESTPDLASAIELVRSRSEISS